MPEVAAWAFLVLIGLAIVAYAVQSARVWRLRMRPAQSEEELLHKALGYLNSGDSGEGVRLLGLLDRSEQMQIRMQAALLKAGVYCERARYGAAVKQFDLAKEIANDAGMSLQLSPELLTSLRRGYLATGNAAAFEEWLALDGKSEQPNLES